MACKECSNEARSLGAVWLAHDPVVGSQAGCAQLALQVALAQGVQRGGVELVGPPLLPQRQQAERPPLEHAWCACGGRGEGRAG